MQSSAASSLKLSRNALRSKRGIWSQAYKMAKGMMPKISPTERAALNAGTVGFDANIFTGDPKLKDLRNYAIPNDPEEQAFLANETHELCEIMDDHKITEDRDFTEEFWSRCKKQGTFM